MGDPAGSSARAPQQPDGKTLNQSASSQNRRESASSLVDDENEHEVDPAAEKALRRKIDLRLCTICGLLASLDLLDSGIISSASVTTMFEDLDLQGNRYSVAIFIFTIASIAFQLPAVIAVRLAGPRLFFGTVTFVFGLITFCTAFIQTWREMIALRVLLGIAMAGIYPGLTYLISTWYTRKEQQLRYAFLQTGEVVILATGSIVNFGLQQLHNHRGLAGWRWMFLVQGVCAMVVGLLTYFWIVDFPENSHRSFYFINAKEQQLAVDRIAKDRGDVHASPFAFKEVLRHALDIKVYGFAVMFFLLNIVSTALSYFLPIILQGGMGFSTNKSILLSAPPYYYAVIPVVLSSFVGDHFQLRGPVIIFNCTCLVIGFVMLGFAHPPAARYTGTFLATGAYVSNWAALSAYYQNNITGQWKRAFTAAVVAAFNGAGGTVGAFIGFQNNSEAPRYLTAIWVVIGSQIIMIGLVSVFSGWFWRANTLQGKGHKIIEETPGFRYTL